ncbi:MAG TPA: hypothetical protein VK730_02025 [Solirubrobacteraceae bacterium]|jgi:hypothetical protein|nr:hypothetical protein [Solirubrobacteraceae bacterium]
MGAKAMEAERMEAEGGEDDAIRALVIRLSRPHRSGGEVIERAAIMAAGADSAAVIAWITDHAGIPEAAAAKAPRHGLHGSRLSGGSEAQAKAPLRFVLPAGALA